MDISGTTVPRSDQINYDDVASSNIIATIADVKRGTTEQPVEIHLAEYPGRPYKPSKSMRRVLVAAWGAEASTYVGRRLELYGDPEVTFGRDKVGGIKIRALSDIDGPLSVALTISRGKRSPYVVEPLKADPLIELLQSAGTLDALKAAWEQVARQGKSNLPELIQVKDARKAELLAEPGATA